MLAAQRAKLERDRSALESTLPALRKAAARGEWVVEISKQEHLRRQFAEKADQIVERARALAEAWNQIEEIAKENDDLNRRLPARAARYGREPLPALMSPQATNLPQVFTQAVASVAELVGRIDVDRARDPFLGKPPVSDAFAHRTVNRAMDGDPITPPAEPEPAAVERGPRFFGDWFGNLAA